MGPSRWGNAMSLLKNPDFENGQASWDRNNMPRAVDLEVITDKNIARTGANFLQFRTAEPMGSVAQSAKVAVAAPPSVTAIAYVRAKDTMVSGALAVWDLDANLSASVPFTVGTAWTQVVAMLDMKSTGLNRTIRIEIYQDKPDLYLYVDSVNAF